MQKENFYNLKDMSQGIQRGLTEGLTARVFPGDQAMISVVRIEAGHKGKLHSHPQEQWGVLLEGSGTRTQGGEEIEVSEGDFWRTPGNVEHTFEAGPEGAVVLDVFAPPRDEYRQEGSGFGGAETE
ncbi:MAG: cupin domain-containing protein [Methyloligellaceae bacterium]